MKTYLIVNPFPEAASHGINNYIINLERYLQSYDFKVEVFYNNKGLNRHDFRKSVKSYVEESYGYEDVIVEAPEVKGATLLLDKKYKVHVRLHTPGAIAQKYDGKAIDEALFEEEIKAIQHASIVSSPSYGVINELSKEVDGSDFYVYKNPFNTEKHNTSLEEKNSEYDIVFMARFQQLKGVEYLNPILELLPDTYSVLLFGSNSDSFKLSEKVRCNVDIQEHDSSSYRFVTLFKSKHLLQLSKFENCSMVVLEGLSNYCIVHAWDVGGNREIANDNVLKLSPLGDVDYLVNQLIDSPSVSESVFEYELANIEKDFTSGLESLIEAISSDKKVEPYRGLSAQADLVFKSLYFSEYKVVSHDRAYNNFGRRIFGFSLSNEHIEEMWMPIIDKFASDYMFISRRPLGFMYKFNNPTSVDKSRYKQFDWMRYPNLLISEIEKFKPHKILFHNGIHPIYKPTLDRVKKAFPNIPIVYSELGWFPQQGNIYFDTKGTNGISNLADMSFEQLCKVDYHGSFKEVISGDYHLIVTQLENDTNMIVNSPRFKSMLSFTRHVVDALPRKEKIIIKTHPLDSYSDRFDQEFKNDANVSVVHASVMDDLLSKSKTVIGINSTVLLQALDYDCNIYAYGHGLLDNKKVCFSLADGGDISKKLYDYQYFSKADKISVKQALVDRQINLAKISNLTVSEVLELEAFSPLLESVATYPNSIEYKKLVEYLDGEPRNLSGNKSIHVKDKNLDSANMKEGVIPSHSPMQKKPTRKRLLNKLKRDPYLYFYDSKVSVLRPLRIFFKKRG